MSVVTYQRPADRVAPGLSFGRVVRSELIKMRSLRSTWITYAVAVILGILFAVLASLGRGSEAYQHHEPLDVAGFPLHGIVIFAQLAIGVVGVLFITGEYATGSIRASITAVPRRLPVLLAKASVLGVVTAAVALVMSFAAFWAGEAMLSSSYHASATLGSHGALLAVLGTSLYIVCVAIIGLGIGFAIRNTGGAIATLVGVLLILPLLVSFLPQSWSDHINKYLPLTIANHMLQTGSLDPTPHALSNGWGAVMLVIYAVAALGIGLTILKRRDV